MCWIGDSEKYTRNFSGFDPELLTALAQNLPNHNERIRFYSAKFLGQTYVMSDSTAVSKLDNSKKLALQPMRFADILDGIFSLYRNHFKLFFCIAVVYHISKCSHVMVDAFFFYGSNSPKIILLDSATSLIEYFVGCFVLGASVYASILAYLGRPITARAAFRQVLRRILPCSYSWLFLFFTFAALTVLILRFFDARSGGSVAVILITSPLAVYFIIRWRFYGMSVLFEEATAMKAFRRSSELVKGTWWRVFGISVAIYLLGLMVMAVLLGCWGIMLSLTGVIESTSVLRMVSRILAPRVNEVGWLSCVLQNLIVASISTFSTLPIWGIGFTLLYLDLRIRKEGFDIEMRARNSQDLM